MRAPTLTATLLVAAAVVMSVSPGARATEPAQAAEQLRDRIQRDVADALARQGAQVPAPAPPAARSRPARMETKGTASGAPSRPAASPHGAPADTTAEGIWAELMEGNRRFVRETTRVRPLALERAELVSAQHPRAIILGCADSRVSPELLFDQSLGDVFVVRTAGNIVDTIALGSIEYAAEHLHARLLVVLGHTGCGAVRAAASDARMPSSHLQAIVDRIHPTVQRLSGCFEGEELVERSVIANARQVAQDVLVDSAILRDAVSRGHLRVVSAVYDLATGAVTPVSAPAATAQAQAPQR